MSLSGSSISRLLLQSRFFFQPLFFVELNLFEALLDFLKEFRDEDQELLFIVGFGQAVDFSTLLCFSDDLFD